MVAVADAELAARLGRERNQGRAPNMDWVDHDRLGFNYRLSEVQAALGIAQLERLDRMLAERERVAALYAERLGALDYGAPAGAGDDAGLVLPGENDGAERRSWFVYAVRLPRGADRDAVVADLSQRGVEAKAYMPCIHLISHIRERFGYREGQFPVAEDASARLLALPFFPSIAEAQIDRVARRSPRPCAATGPRSWAPAAPRIDSAERSTSSAVVCQPTIEIRITARPRKLLPPSQQVPSRCTRSITASVTSSLSPKRTRTWLRTTSLRTSTPSAAASVLAIRRAWSQHPSTIAATPSRPSERSAA